MPVGYSAPEDVINAGLREAGYPRSISEIYEGSRASRVAVEVYGPARDYLMQQHDWDFGLKDGPLAATVGGVLILGFTAEYNYPSDALRIRAVHGAIPSPNNDPQPVRWTTGIDAALGTKVIFTSQAAALAVYTPQITDPAKWSVAFTRAFVNLLAKIFAFALRDDINLAAARTTISDRVTMEAADTGDSMSPMVPELMARAAAAAQR